MLYNVNTLSLKIDVSKEANGIISAFLFYMTAINNMNHEKKPLADHTGVIRLSLSTTEKRQHFDQLSFISVVILPMM